MEKKFLGMIMERQNLLKILKRVELLVNILSGIKMEKKRYQDSSMKKEYEMVRGPLGMIII